MCDPDQITADIAAPRVVLRGTYSTSVPPDTAYFICAAMQGFDLCGHQGQTPASSRGAMPLVYHPKLLFGEGQTRAASAVMMKFASTRIYLLQYYCLALSKQEGCQLTGDDTCCQSTER